MAGQVTRIQAQLVGHRSSCSRPSWSREAARGRRRAGGQAPQADVTVAPVAAGIRDRRNWRTGANSDLQGSVAAPVCARFCASSVNPPR